MRSWLAGMLLIIGGFIFLDLTVVQELGLGALLVGFDVVVHPEGWRDGD